jgi:hypothetical protein
MINLLFASILLTTAALVVAVLLTRTNSLRKKYAKIL